MTQVNDLLTLRTKKNESHSKMAEMARQSTSGHLTSFSGVFSVAELTSQEKDSLQELLSNYFSGQTDVTADLKALISLTSEVKAINNQAALLHGERIKKAHQILTRYRDGAFTGWLQATYGNRQTPYNFLQYYEFHQALSTPMRLRLEEMPRQAVYTLASRNGSLERKQQIVEGYKGETKAALLDVIRRQFPLEKKDQRREDVGEKILQGMQKVILMLQSPDVTLTDQQKASFSVLLKELKDLRY
ncbi:MAG: CT583 family protein [Parachlamydiaceae bacterium]|nr:CT583 family protein [Parachlamydiaceae bacterium]